MRNFRLVWEPAASLDVLNARAFLGVVRAAALDEEINEACEKLSLLPEKGHPVKTRRKSLGEVKRVIFARSPYILYYRLSLATERVVVIALCHERARPPKF